MLVCKEFVNYYAEKGAIVNRKNILIATAIVLGIIFLLVVVFRKRIVIAIALIKEGSK